MSDYKEYLMERERIDQLITQGYVIDDVQENLSGAFVKFGKADGEIETLHVKTADGRKYFSNLIFQQRQNV